MATYRIPGVHIDETAPGPPAIADVETAIPAFIGHTEQAVGPDGLDLTRRPTRIHSYAEYEQSFGGPATPTITVVVTTSRNAVTALAVTPPQPAYLLAHAVRHYFGNGGATCFIVSVGSYGEPLAAGSATTGLLGGIAVTALEDEPTLLVIPEAVRLDEAGYASLCSAALLQCATLKNRFAIFDLRDGDKPKDRPRLAADRALFGNDHLSHGAAYTPWLRTTITHPLNADESNVMVALDGAAAAALGTLQGTHDRVYHAVKAALRDHTVVLPASGAVAGVYAATDNTRGVWKAPANVRLNQVIAPAVPLDNARQSELNVDAATGKSINALRSFPGKGTLVWGARTLAGNDNEWRYVNVRRFVDVVQVSAAKGTRWVVFEPNDANTWARLRGAVENYLVRKWRQGALAGVKAEDAFFVRCGLGHTMTEQDLLDGRLVVEIGLAVVRPAEYIILRFSHTLQAC